MPRKKLNGWKCPIKHPPKTGDTILIYYGKLPATVYVSGDMVNPNVKYYLSVETGKILQDIGILYWRQIPEPPNDLEQLMEEAVQKSKELNEVNETVH